MADSKKNITPEYHTPGKRSSSDKLKLQLRQLRCVVDWEYIINSMPDAALILNSSRQAVYANTALLKLLDADLDDVIGKRPGELFNCVYAKDAPDGCGTSDFCKYCGAVKTIIGALNRLPGASECSITDADMETSRLKVWTSPLEVGEEVFSLFYVRDITPVFRRQRTERSFFGNLLNMLSNIDVMFDVEESGELTLDEQKRHVLRLTKTMNEQINIIQDIIAIESDELETNFTKLDSNIMLKDVAGFFGGDRIAENRRIVLPKENDNISFMSDARLVRRIMINLLKNALEASRDHDILNIDCVIERNNVVFSIYNPQYIPVEDQKLVFRQSFSTKGSGRGYGTYTAKTLAEHYLNGKLWFSSSPRKGTTFFVSFPLESEA